MIRLIYCLSLIATILFISCRSENSTAEVADTIIEDCVPEDFLSFYLRFHADSLYQLDHIIFPLQVRADGSPWTRDNWKKHNYFDNRGGEFVQMFTHLSGIIFEKIADRRGLYQIEKRYSKTGDSYQLIYYSVKNAFQESEEWQ